MRIARTQEAFGEAQITPSRCSYTATTAGVSEIPAWVEDMDDDRAYMELVLSNAQGELSPLEIGMHALRYVPRANGGRGKKGGLCEYADRLNRDFSDILKYRKGAEVLEKCGNIPTVADLLIKAST